MDPRRLSDLRVTEATQCQETGWALVVKAFYSSVESRAVDLIVQRNQPTFTYRSIISGSIRDLRNRSEDNNAEKKGMKRYREELNRRPAMRRQSHQITVKPGLYRCQQDRRLRLVRPPALRVRSDNFWR